jgi:HK97 family phage major capsid protein
MTIKQMQEKRGSLVREADVLLQQGIKENRKLNNHEDLRFGAIKEEIFQLDTDLAREMRSLSLDPNRPGNGGSDMDLSGYSLSRAITQAGQGRLDGYELEVSQEIARRSGKAASGFYVPHALMSEKRAMSVTGGTSQQYGGGYVATEVRGFIDSLRPFLKVAQAGATILDGLTSNISIPRQSAASTASWKAETAELDEATPNISQLELVPRRVGAFTQLSKQLLIQGTPDVEKIVRADLMSACATALDAAAIAGAGGTAPTGILATTGIGAVIGGTNGAAPTWANIVALVGKVADANADAGSLGFLMNSKVASKLRSTQKITSTDSKMILEAAELLGYAVHVSNNVPGNLTKGTANGTASAIIFGNWADVILASFGSGLDLIVDPFTQATAGITRVIINSYCDVGIRRSASFAACKDVLTA